MVETTVAPSLDDWTTWKVVPPPRSASQPVARRQPQADDWRTWKEVSSPIVQQPAQQSAQPVEQPAVAAPAATPAEKVQLYKKAGEVFLNAGDRRKVLGIIRSIPPKQRGAFLEQAQEAARSIQGGDRPFITTRMVQGIGEGVRHMGQDIMELVGAGGTDEEIELINKLEGIQAGTFAPARPDDPWYSKWPVQAAQMTPAMIEMVRGGMMARAGARILGFGPKAARAAQTGGIAGTMFPGAYAQAYQEQREAGASRETAKPVAAITALTIGALESIIPNPFKAKAGPLIKGVKQAVVRHLLGIAKNYPGEWSEEFLQGAAGGAGRVTAAYLDKEAPDLGLGTIFEQAWREGIEAAGPLAVMMGAGGLAGSLAGLPARPSRAQFVRAGGTRGANAKQRKAVVRAAKAEAARIAQEAAKAQQAQAQPLTTQGESDAISQREAEQVHADVQAPIRPEVAKVPQQEAGPGEGRRGVPPGRQVEREVPGEEIAQQALAPQVREEVAPSRTYSIKNATTAADREAKGMPERIVPDRRGWEAVRAEAEAATEQEIDALMNEARENPDLAVTDIQAAMLLRRKVDLEKQYAEKVSRGEDSATTRDDLLDAYNIYERVGTVSGRGLAARKMEVDDDFSLSHRLAEGVVAKKGKPLTPEEIEATQKGAERIAELETQLEKRRDKIVDERIAQAVEKIIGEPKPAQQYHPKVLAAAERWVNWIEAQAEPASLRLKNYFSGAVPQAGLPVKVLADAAIVGAAKLSRGMLTLSEWTASMVADYGPNFGPHAGEVWEASHKQIDSGFKKAKISQTKRPVVKKAIVDLYEKKITRAEKAIDRVIKQLEADLAAGKIGRKVKADRLTSPLLEAKRARLEELRTLREEMRTADPEYQRTEEERSNLAYKRNLQKRLADILELNVQPDTEAKFAKKPLKKRVLNKEELDTLYEIEQEKTKFQIREEKWRRERRTPVMKVLGAGRAGLHLWRAFKTCLDYSAVLFQGGLTVAGHPILAAKTLPKMVSAGWSKKGEFAANEALRNRPNFHLYRRDKLAITVAGGLLRQQEEAFMGRLSKHIPGIAGSERAFTTLLNEFRALLYDIHAGVLAPDGMTPEQGKAIANFANAWTGRGSLGYFEGAAVGLADIFFAPRNFVSAIQVILGQPMWKGDAKTRKLIAKEYARTLIGYGLLYGMVSLYKAMNDDDEYPQIGTDPLDSEFGKIRIGNTLIDPLRGLSQMTVFLSRMSASTYYGTKSLLRLQVSKDERKHMARTMPTVGRFFQYKLAPWWGTAADIATGKTFDRQPTTPASVGKEIVAPLVFEDIYESMQEQGIAGGTALSLLAIFGLRIQTYPPKKPLKKRW